MIDTAVVFRKHCRILNPMRFPVFILCLTVLVLPSCSKEFTAIVISVPDGDTFVVQHGSERKKIRFYGIDCPEGNQRYGKEARQFTASLIASQTVRIETLYNDPYDRIVARVYLPDDRYVNGEIVAAGFAWWFKKYAENDQQLQKLESEARAARKGIWSDRNPEAPWNFRRM